MRLELSNLIINLIESTESVKFTGFSSDLKYGYIGKLFAVSDGMEFPLAGDEPFPDDFPGPQAMRGSTQVDWERVGRYAYMF